MSSSNKSQLYTRNFCTAHTYVFLDGVATVPQPGRFDVTCNDECEGISIYDLIRSMIYDLILPQNTVTQYNILHHCLFRILCHRCMKLQLLGPWHGLQQLCCADGLFQNEDGAVKRECSRHGQGLALPPEHGNQTTECLSLCWQLWLNMICITPQVETYQHTDKCVLRLYLKSNSKPLYFFLQK